MSGSDLIVELPWILFGLFLVGIGFRLRGFRRLPRPPRDVEAHRPESDENSSASLSCSGDSAGNDRRGAPPS